MSNSEAQDEWIQVRVSEDLKQSARIQAAKAGKSMSEHIRDLIRSPTEQDKVSTPDTSNSEPSGDFDGKTDEE